MWTWDLSDLEFRLTGVDTDAAALAERQATVGDLDVAVCADLRTFELDSGSFDIVHSAYVLEHIAGAEQVLLRMLDALRPGGLMVVRIPDGNSVYGFITRRTPHRLHVTYKRRVRKKNLAGTAGHGPYPVVYDEVISLCGLQKWAQNHGLETVDLFGDNSHTQFFGRLEPVCNVALKGIASLSIGRLTARYSNLIAVFRKPTSPD